MRAMSRNIGQFAGVAEVGDAFSERRIFNLWWRHYAETANALERKMDRFGAFVKNKAFEGIRNGREIDEQ